MRKQPSDQFHPVANLALAKRLPQMTLDSLRRYEEEIGHFASGMALDH
jgi:hypothetical protein